MSRNQPDGYYVPTNRARRERRSRSRKNFAMPIFILAGVVAIPALSITMSDSWNDNVAHANVKTSTSRDEKAAQLRATLRTHLRDDQLDSMKTDYLRNRSGAILRRDLNRYADDISQSKYTNIPLSIRRIVRENLTSEDIHLVKQWVVETNPSPEDLIFTAEVEFAENLGVPADNVSMNRNR